MGSLDRCASMPPLEIISAFDRYLSTVGAPSQERDISIPIAAAIIVLWGFLRDDGQFVASSDCLAEFATYAGPSAVAHHLRRRDIPKAMIEKAISAFGVCPDSDASFSSEWDLTLHKKHFVPFTSTLT